MTQSKLTDFLAMIALVLGLIAYDAVAQNASLAGPAAPASPAYASLATRGPGTPAALPAITLDAIKAAVTSNPLTDAEITAITPITNELAAKKKELDALQDELNKLRADDIAKITELLTPAQVPYFSALMNPRANALRAGSNRGNLRVF